MIKDVVKLLEVLLSLGPSCHKLLSRSLSLSLSLSTPSAGDPSMGGLLQMKISTLLLHYRAAALIDPSPRITRTQLLLAHPVDWSWGRRRRTRG